MTRGFLKNEPTDLKFCTVGRVVVPYILIQKKIPKNFPPTQNGIFDIVNEYPRISTKEPLKDEECDSEFIKIKI